MTSNKVHQTLFVKLGQNKTASYFRLQQDLLKATNEAKYQIRPWYWVRILVDGLVLSSENSLRRILFSDRKTVSFLPRLVPGNGASSRTDKRLTSKARTNLCYLFFGLLPPLLLCCFCVFSLLRESLLGHLINRCHRFIRAEGCDQIDGAV